MFNIVLGGGITGLITGYYKQGYMVITDQIGGQMASYFDLGPRYLHKTEKVVKFLKSLSIPINLKTIKVGYVDDSGWVENPDLAFRQSYFMKSRGQKSIIGFDNTVLNTNIKEFSVCDISFRDLIRRLYDSMHSRIYIASIEKIDLVDRLIKFNQQNIEITTKFHNLISTIPLNVFFRLSNLKDHLKVDLKSTSMSYCLMTNDFFDIKDYDYVYDNRTTTWFHRMTKCSKGIVCDVLDQNKDLFIKQNSNYLALPQDKAITTVKNSQIISLDKDFSIDDDSIKFYGRYGAWNRRWKTETIIEEVINE